MAKSTRTLNRRMRYAYLLKIQELINHAFTMQKQDLEKINLPTLKHFFYFLQRNVKIDEDVEKYFYSLSKKQNSSMLADGTVSRERPVFKKMGKK